MKEPELRELKGSSRLALGFFNSLIRRIECTKPVAGSGISVQESATGIVINSTATPVSGGGGIPDGFTAVTVNVCSGGIETQLVILAKPIE